MADEVFGPRRAAPPLLTRRAFGTLWYTLCVGGLGALPLGPVASVVRRAITPEASRRAPNLYELRGAGLRVTYSTTGIDGRPRFVYRDGADTLSFEGDEIRTSDTEIGTLVTVTIVQTVDTGSTSFTVLVPRVNLDETGRAPVVTEGITTDHRFSVIPAFETGQMETYRVGRLSGTASLVES